MSKITYEEYVEAAKMEGFEIEFTEEDFDALSEEQLDELKASTKLSYINKASRDRTSAGMDFGKANTDDERKAASDKMRKRGVGISRAATSLAMKASNYDAGLKKEEKEEDEDEKSEKKEKKHSKKEMSESAASDTLKPFSKHADSRTSMMASVVSVMGGMPKKDLVKWFDQTMSQFGPNKNYGVGDNSAKNKASIAMKAVKENEDLMITNRSGIIIRMAVSTMRVIGRATQGVRVIRLDEDDAIADVAVIPYSPEIESAEVDENTGISAENSVDNNDNQDISDGETENPQEL
jgi:DNA gyrase/topoisomerase IV subunit A